MNATSSSYYDSIAKDYDTLFLDPLSEAENEVVQSDLNDIIRKINKRRIRVLDLGCGTGLGLDLIEAIAKKLNIEVDYYGIDISQSMIDIAKSKYGSASVHLCQGDMGILPVYIQSIEFDLVLSLFGSFSHTRNARSLITELLKKYTTNRAVLYLMTYSRFSFKNLYAFIKSFNWGKLSFAQQYNIRNSQVDSSCKAYFYCPARIKKIIPIAFHKKIKFKTINGIFEIPLFKRLIKKMRTSSIYSILKFERSLLSHVPSLGHSLVTIIEK